MAPAPPVLSTSRGTSVSSIRRIWRTAGGEGSAGTLARRKSTSEIHQFYRLSRKSIVFSEACQQRVLAIAALWLGGSGCICERRTPDVVIGMGQHGRPRAVAALGGDQNGAWHGACVVLWFPDGLRRQCEARRSAAAGQRDMSNVNVIYDLRISRFLSLFK